MSQNNSIPSVIVDGDNVYVVGDKINLIKPEERNPGVVQFHLDMDEELYETENCMVIQPGRAEWIVTNYVHVYIFEGFNGENKIVLQYMYMQNGKFHMVATCMNADSLIPTFGKIVDVKNRVDACAELTKFINGIMATMP